MMVINLNVLVKEIMEKNFRSAHDLKILGRWIKGQMENAGALKLGDKVTEETFKKVR